MYFQFLRENQKTSAHIGGDFFAVKKSAPSSLLPHDFSTIVYTTRNARMHETADLKSFVVNMRVRERSIVEQFAILSLLGKSPQSVRHCETRAEFFFLGRRFGTLAPKRDIQKFQLRVTTRSAKLRRFFPLQKFAYYRLSGIINSAMLADSTPSRPPSSPFHVPGWSSSPGSNPTAFWNDLNWRARRDARLFAKNAMDVASYLYQLRFHVSSYTSSIYWIFAGFIYTNSPINCYSLGTSFRLMLFIY